MELLIIGTGYVGLVSGACLAEMGHHVTCLDIATDKIDALNRGIIPFYEPGLPEIVHRNQAAKRLHFTSDYASAIKKKLVCFIAVNTPIDNEGKADLQALYGAASSLAMHMDGYLSVVTKSTVPVGTTHALYDYIKNLLVKQGKKIDFDVIANPEFLKEGDAVQDFMRPDRIVIGCDSPHAAELMRKVYAPFMLSHERLLIMDPLSAEMTKYAANAMLATRISFMNEMAKICEKMGANIHSVRKGMGADPRIGYRYLYPGLGYGGSCLPKDLRALSEQAKQHQIAPHLLDAVALVNELQRHLMVQKIEEYFALHGGLQGKTLAIWGLSFKPDTDDMREAPSIPLIRQLLEQHVTLRLFDPVAMDNARRLLGNSDLITWCENELQAVLGADGLVLVTEWKQFRLPDFEAVKKKMRHHVLFDGRNQYHKEEMVQQGFDYICIGQKPAYRYCSEVGYGFSS